MTRRFEFATAGRVVFGAGAAEEVGAIARPFGRRALVVAGRRPDPAAFVRARLAAAGLSSAIFIVPREPDVALVREGAAAARDAEADLVVAIGGGSVLDCGKAVAVLAANGGDVLDYVEVVGRGRPLASDARPVIAIPTTAGTGSEATRNGVIAVPEAHVKVSLRTASMLPRVAIVDSALTRDLPASLTAATGLDALTQLIEPYVSIRANAMTDVLAVDGMRLAATALPRAWRDGGDRTARDDMAMASLLGGMALANAGLGAVHGLAAAIGGRFHAPHGAVCAALLPYVFAANARALANRDRDSNAVRLARFDDVARIVTGRPTATATDGAEWLHALIRELGIPPLRTYGITPVHVSDLVAASRRASSMKGNPVELSEAELTRILMEEGDRS